jgi:hypothetical protein
VFIDLGLLISFSDTKLLRILCWVCQNWIGIYKVNRVICHKISLFVLDHLQCGRLLFTWLSIFLRILHSAHLGMQFWSLRILFWRFLVFTQINWAWKFKFPVIDFLIISLLRNHFVLIRSRSRAGARSCG